ncbi:MAG: HlyC/CorC family transporter [Thermoleophilia bacterium]|nr:HlyC/CorC family transporter [Thermoleophilia bacterium]
MSDTLRILAIFLLVLGNAVFVGAEYALVTARRTRLEPEAEAGSRRARAALDLMDHPTKFISTVQIGITVFGIALGAIGQPLVTEYFDGPLSHVIAYALAFVILTYLSVALGELVPKAIALQRAEGIAKFLAVPLEVLQTITKPFNWVLQESADFVTRLFGVQPAPAGELAHTEEDIRHIVAASEDAGVIATTEEEMLYKVFDFADKEVHEVMVPRPQVVAISVSMPTEEALAALLASPYTRYPVYRESLDEIVGILHVRDLFSALHDRGMAKVDLEELLRPAYIVPETKDLAALLAEFRKQNQHMAIVVDEYGAMQGIVTLEDLLEEIVGEIEDEFDLPDESVERIDESRIRIEGTFPIDDFNEQFGTEIEVEDYHTMAGVVFGELGRAPEVGDEVQINGTALRVVEIEGSRIQKLEVEFTEPIPEPAPVEGA